MLEVSQGLVFVFLPLVKFVLWGHISPVVILKYLENFQEIY